MSQVWFKSTLNGKDVNVMGGWDEPLQYFFLTIFNANAADDEDDVVWSELDHHDFDELKNIDVIKRDLDELGIEPPNNFWSLIERKEGNVIHGLEL